jgi:hypothetical protein
VDDVSSVNPSIERDGAICSVGSGPGLWEEVQAYHYFFNERTFCDERAECAKVFGRRPVLLTTALITVLNPARERLKRSAEYVQRSVNAPH